MVAPAEVRHLAEAVLLHRLFDNAFGKRKKHGNMWTTWYGSVICCFGILCYYLLLGHPKIQSRYSIYSVVMCGASSLPQKERNINCVLSVTQLPVRNLREAPPRNSEPPATRQTSAPGSTAEPGHQGVCQNKSGGGLCAYLCVCYIYCIIYIYINLYIRQ